MPKSLALDRLPAGHSAYVIDMQNEPAMRRRLADLGLIPGTNITCLFHSPAGDPTAYSFRGAVIALRNRDAAQIQVEPIRAPVTAAAAEAPA